MAGRRKFGFFLFSIALLMHCAAGASIAQTAAGSLAGRVTDLHSRPLAGATVILRNQATGAEERTITARNGAYRFSSLGPGEYSLEAREQSLGHGRLDGILIVAGHEARVQAALAFIPEAQQSAPISVPARAAVEANETYLPLVTVADISRPMPYIPPTPTAVPETVVEKLPPVELRAAITFPEPMALRGMPAPVLVAVPRAAAMPALRNVGSTVVQAAALAANAARQGAELEAITVAARSSDDLTSSGTTFTAAELQALPLSGGNWEAVALITHETAPDDSRDDVAAPAGRTFAAGVQVDGLDTRLAFAARSSGRTQGRSASLIGPGSGIAALHEVQTATGIDSRTHVETTRGSDSLHGQALLLVRQGLWSAQNPATQWTREIAPATTIAIPQFAELPITPVDREGLWNLDAGGRLARTHLLWFASLDGQRRNDPGISMVKHAENFFAQPSNDQMQVLAARLGLSSVDPVSEGVAAYSGMLETLDGLLGPTSRTVSSWTGFGRLDGSLGQQSRFMVEFSDVERDAPGGGLTRAAESYGVRSFGESHTQEQWLMARWERQLAPNILSVTQAAYGHHALSHSPEAPSAFEQTLNINAWGRLPQMVVDSTNGFTIGNPARFGPGSYPDENMYKAQEQLAWIRGKFQLRAGFELSHNSDTTTFLRNQAGTYTYSRVENFVSDALTFAAFGLNGQLNPLDQHNCDETGKVWRDAEGVLHGLGYLPCYSHYTQTLGPSRWWLQTNDWAGDLSLQRRAGRQWTLSLALRWELEQAPPAIAWLVNPDLPLAGQMPSFGGEWGPRAGLAWSASSRYAPTVRFGYGLYFSRTPNATLQTALTQTGSLKGDLKYFIRLTDNLNAGGAPPFPYVLAGEPSSSAKPEAVEFAPGFRNGEIHQAVASIEEIMPGHLHIEAAIAASLARRLPLLFDANVDPSVNPGTITYAIVDGNGSGPIKAPQITVPFYATWPSSTGTSGRINSNYQRIGEIFSSANSTYEAASLRLTRNGRRGITFHSSYTYAHAMDWNPDDSVTFTRPSVLDPADRSAEYGTSDLDVRHSATLALIWQPRWRSQLWKGGLTNGWSLSTVGSFRSGLPYTMRTSSALPREFTVSGTLIEGLGTGMNGYGGDNRVYGVGRNTFRYPATWKADLRLAKRFSLGELRELELLAETFNLFNHQNVTELETVGYSIDSGTVSGGLPSLHYLTGLKTGQTEFGHPLNVDATDYYRPRQLEFGMRMRF